MSTATDHACPRCLSTCTPAANVVSDEEGKSFVCVGFNRKKDRTIPQDRFTLCWKNEAVDEMGHWDKRDLLDTMSVIAQALSVDENIRVNEDFTEKDMQEANLL